MLGIVRAQTGQPFNISRTTPAALNELTAGQVRPNRDLSVPWDKITSGTTAGCPGVAGERKLGGPDLYFDPCAFSMPGSRQMGNLARLPILAPGIAKWDFAISKETGLTERWRLQFRAEAFNLTNRVNFGRPAGNVFTAGGGRIGSAGRISSASMDSRQMQFSLKLLF